ncbi:unnamed protein product [Linum trigynum]|uniref:S-protein homolog n=2 Tax=Linum trigynum TaxID=586398 RepID=A0AAV2D1T8_9ROSI
MMTMSRRNHQLVMTTIMIIITVVLMAGSLMMISDARIINIKNKIGSKKALIVHCEYVDGDLGALAVSSGDVYRWEFEGDFRQWPPAVFWCHLALGDGRLSFLAYIEQQCAAGDAVMRYDVNETGLYGLELYNTYKGYVLLRAWNRAQLP